ncbi:HisM ABC-type amino acid transport system, permease component [Candidatus Nanopelagicaceae bacterium]
MESLSIWLEYFRKVAGGLGSAAQLASISLALGYPLAVGLAILLDHKKKAIRWIAILLVELGRGIPLLVLLYIFYQGLPQVDVIPSSLTSAVLAFTWSTAGYATEIIRASIHGVSKGQSEAADSIGLNSRDRLRFIVIPQALRISIPPLLGLAIIMFQLTSLAYVITFSEIMQAAYFLGTKTFDYLLVFSAAAAVYAVVTIPFSLLLSHLEKRISRHVA